MPTVNLTPQQQASVDAANKVLADAQASYDKALSNFNAVKSNFCGGWWNYLSNCDIRNADSKALNAALAYAWTNPFGIAANVLHNWTQKKWTPPSSCDDAIQKGTIVTWECHTGKGDCKSKSGCNDRVGEYNAKLDGIYAAANALDGEKVKIKSAKENLDAVLDAIAKDPTVSANANIINNEINAQKQKDMIKWAFFGLAAILIVGGAIWLGMKVLRGGGSAA